MAKKSGSVFKIVGLILLVVGIGVGVWAYQMSQSVVEQFNKTMNGGYSLNVMAMYIGAVTSCVLGGFFFAKK